MSSLAEQKKPEDKKKKGEESLLPEEELVSSFFPLTNLFLIYFDRTKKIKLSRKNSSFASKD